MISTYRYLIDAQVSLGHETRPLVISHIFQLRVPTHDRIGNIHIYIIVHRSYVQIYMYKQRSLKITVM